MKIYIKSGTYVPGQDVDEEAHPIVTYYNFLLNHQKDLNNYLKRKIQQYFGVTPFTYRVDLGRPFLFDNGFTDEMQIGIYAEIDIITASLSKECEQHVTYDPNGGDFTSLGYDGHNFYGILYDYYYPSCPDDLNSLDYAYHRIDTCLEDYEKNIDKFIKRLNDDVNYVQHIYDEFKNDADLRFVIRADDTVYLKMYDNTTGYTIFDDRICYRGSQQGSEEQIYKALDKYVYSPDSGNYVLGHVIVTYDKKKVKVNSELKPKMNSISAYLQRNWDCIVRPHKSSGSGNRLEFNIVCRNQHDFQEIVNYIENNISYDVSLEATFDHYSNGMYKLLEQFLDAYGE